MIRAETMRSSALLPSISLCRSCVSTPAPCWFPFPTVNVTVFPVPGETALSLRWPSGPVEAHVVPSGRSDMRSPAGPGEGGLELVGEFE